MLVTHSVFAPEFQETLIKNVHTFKPQLIIRNGYPEIQYTDSLNIVVTEHDLTPVNAVFDTLREFMKWIRVILKLDTIDLGIIDEQKFIEINETIRERIDIYESEHSVNFKEIMLGFLGFSHRLSMLPDDVKDIVVGIFEKYNIPLDMTTIVEHDNNDKIIEIEYSANAENRVKLIQILKHMKSATEQLITSKNYVCDVPTHRRDLKNDFDKNIANRFDAISELSFSFINTNIENASVFVCYIDAIHADARGRIKVDLQYK